MPGCGQCCYFLFPTYSELVSAEDVAGSPLPQFPGARFFAAGMNMKTIEIEHGGDVEVVGPVCPLLYAADRNYQAFPVKSASVRKESIDTLEGPGGEARHEESASATVVVEGSPDYTLLCGIHQMLQSEKLAGTRFDLCREWRYEPDAEKLENGTCLCGIEQLEQRLRLKG